MHTPRPHARREIPRTTAKPRRLAYAHLAPLLTKLAQRLKKPVADLRVWDPYHCAGGVISRLGALGFTHVVNDPELDFYDVVDGAAPPPPHDVLVTNPPFSGNHARALFLYLRSKDGKKGDATPFAVLAPEYVHRKAWYAPSGRCVLHGARVAVRVRRRGRGPVGKHGRALPALATRAAVSEG